MITWIKRVEKVAQVHGASDGVTLLAASCRLTKTARKWYEIQTGAVLESWTGLKDEIIKIFDKQIPFYKQMQKIEARKWVPQKKSFDQYVIEKLALMHRIDVSKKDSIQLLIGGITHPGLRATALSVSTDALNSFLERMRHITNGVADLHYDKKISNGAPGKTKDSTCRNCGKKGHQHKECRGEANCFYCKKKGHRTYECPALKRKEVKPGSKVQPSTLTTATVTDSTAGNSTPENSAAKILVAAVEELDRELITDNAYVKVHSLNGEPRNLSALIDTGSPVSFVKSEIYVNVLKVKTGELAMVKSKLRNLSNRAISILGIVNVKLRLEKIRNLECTADLHILEENTFEGDIILGRDFIREQRLTLIYSPQRHSSFESKNLFAHLPLCIEENVSSKSIGDMINSCEIDYDLETKQKLKDIILEVINSKVPTVEDDYTVQVHYLRVRSTKICSRGTCSNEADYRRSIS